MSNYVVGAKYVNRKSGKVVAIGSVNEKCKTLIVDFLDGTNRTMVWSNFAKSYTPAEKPEKSVENAEKSDSKAETEKATKNAEKPAGKTSEKKARKKSGVSEEERMALKASLVDFLNALQVEAKTWENYPFSMAVRFPEKTIFNLELRLTHIRLRGISELLPKDLAFKPVKGGFDVTLNYKYDEVDKMKSMIEYTVKNFKDSDLVKRKSKAKKAEPEKKSA